jgi:hypothetical protein
MEIETGVAVVGGAIASKDVLLKVLGPTADYVGGELKNLVQRCNINLSDVFASSLRKGAEHAAGSVDARTAKSIFDDAAYCDDGLIKDYYGGLLCGSKSENGDDSALSYVSILKGMSRIQVKTHFLIYAVLHKSLAGSLPSITVEEERNKVRLIIGLDRYFSFINQDQIDGEATINHVVSGLLRAGLIGPFFQYGVPEFINSRFPELDVKTPSLVVCPSILGVELFLWAAGIRNPNPNLIVQADAEILSRYPEEYRDAV